MGYMYSRQSKIVAAALGQRAFQDTGPKSP